MNLELTMQDIEAVAEHFKHRPQDMFLIDFARQHIARRRYLEAKDRLKISDDHDSIWDDAISHNLGGLDTFGAVARTNRLIRPLYAIDRVFANARHLKALCVGPRTEMELLSLVGQGFQPGNIKGLDLFSYSPWIEVGNMHNMPFADNSFDVVIAGWVLTYSSDPERACREFLRVAGDRGIIAIGATALSAADQAVEPTGRSKIHYPRTDDLLKIFGDAVRNVYVRHESESPDEEGRTIVIFDVRK